MRAQHQYIPSLASSILSSERRGSCGCEDAPFSAALAVGARTRVPDRFVRHGCGGWVAVKVLKKRKALVRWIPFAISMRAIEDTHLKSYGLLVVVAWCRVGRLSEFRIWKVRFFALPSRANRFRTCVIWGFVYSTITHACCLSHHRVQLVLLRINSVIMVSEAYVL